MKIMQIIPNLGYGGAEKLAVELSNELSLNNQVTLVSLKKVEKWMYLPQMLCKNVDLIELNKKNKVRILLKIYLLLKQKHPDVVHIHLTTALYYFIPFVFLFKKIKYVFTIHSSFEVHSKLFKRLSFIPFYKRVANICLSKTIYNKFVQHVPNMNFYKIENGINKSKPTHNLNNISKEIQKIKKEFDWVFLFVGRLSSQKNIPGLLNVFIDTTLNNIKLLIIGDGEKEIKNKIINVSNQTYNRIQYLGVRNDVIDYMRCVDALVLTSHNEGMPIVVLEALSAGLPVISTPVGAIPDIIKNNINGYLSESNSKKDILNAIKSYTVSDKVNNESIKSNNCFLFNRLFTIESCANRHLKLYSEITKQ